MTAEITSPKQGANPEMPDGQRRAVKSPTEAQHSGFGGKRRSRMNEIHSGKKDLAVILGLVVLIAVLGASVCLIFAGLEAMAPQPEPSLFTALNDQSGRPSPYGMRLLTEEERQARDVGTWLKSAKEMAGDRVDKEHDAFWLCRQDTDVYILYLPDQDRVLTAADVTATEETAEDGVVVLVLRARTPEGGEEVVPEEQLLYFQTDSKNWNGIRIQVILDGREQQVYKLAAKGDRIYSTEELYIGRD